jgi:hypothetical protein
MKKEASLKRQLGLFDATMIVSGAIILGGLPLFYFSRKKEKKNAIQQD